MNLVKLLAESHTPLNDHFGSIRSNSSKMSKGHGDCIA